MSTHYKSPLILLTLLTLNSCVSDKYHLNACFTTDKHTASTGDTIIFINCTDWGTSSGERKTSWEFGDGSSLKSDNNDTVRHIYSKAGDYNVLIYLSTAGPETKGGHFRDKISIK